MTGNSEERVKAVLDVFQSRLRKRAESLKALEVGELQPSGKEYKLSSTLKEGLSSENAKKREKLDRDEGASRVKVQMQRDELRASSKSRDALQDVIGLLKKADVNAALQFVNYRKITTTTKQKRPLSKSDRKALTRARPP